MTQNKQQHKNRVGRKQKVPRNVGLEFKRATATEQKQEDTQKSMLQFV